VLERGREFLPGSFPERFADLPAQVRVNLGEEPKARVSSKGFSICASERTSARCSETALVAVR
jgi:hypothetical protein